MGNIQVNNGRQINLITMNHKLMGSNSTSLTRTSTQSFKLRSKGSPSGPAISLSKTSGKMCDPIKYLNTNPTIMYKVMEKI